MTPLAIQLLAAFALAFTIMSVLWLVQRKTGNAGIVDIGWSGTIPLIVVFAVLLIGNPSPIRLALLLAMAVLWGGRLVWHIHRRSHGKPEDGRYAELRRAWGAQVQPKMFLFFQFQAAAAVLFSMPFLLSLGQSSATLLPLEIAAFLLWLFAWLGEASADRQLARFKRDPASKGKVCEAGWWHYSRHPNYFFEWLIWVANALFAWSAPGGPWALLCPVLMLFFLFKVTGIPATEEQALKSKGDAYRRYQQTTSVFVPLPRRRA
jgi:steroid 5-alpha reductase family enzyme